jgi:hypothetical protein
MHNYIRSFLLSSLTLLLFISSSSAAGIIRTGVGADAATLKPIVDQFRADLGDPLNPNVVGSFQSGRREINWDGVPDGFSSPNTQPANFFNANSPRGAVFTTPCENATFRVSAKTGNPTNTPVRFGEIDPSYTDTFEVFSPQRLFTVVGADAPCSKLSVLFFVPGTSIPAETSGFGMIFTDVDIPGHARFTAYDKDGNVLDPGVITSERSNNGLSFIGVSFSEPKIARVDIESGKTGLFPGVVDSVPGNDVVAMDDFLYGEPQQVTP